MFLTIYADSKHVGQCRSCGAVITWAELLNGNKMPFHGRITTRPHVDLFPDPARALETVDTREHVSHFAICRHAAQHRKAARA